MRVEVASDPVCAIVFDPGSGRLYSGKSAKLLLRPLRPGHKNEIARIFRLTDFKGRTVFNVITSRPLQLRDRHPTAA